MATIQEALTDVCDGSVRHIVSVSGGKDSAALAVYMRQNYPQIPTEYVFCDTGCELEETYEYLERLQSLLGRQIVRLNAMELLGVEEKHGRTPFDIYLTEMYGGYLPNPQSRWCTRALKIEPFEAYVADARAYSYIGIRADEDREGYVPKKPPRISQLPNIVPVYPFKDDGITLLDVKQLLEDSGLGLPDYYRWRSRSGCYFCFYQQVGEWQRLKEEHPELFEKARGYEKASGEMQFTWCDRRTLDEIAAMEKKPLPTMDEAEGCAVCHL